MPYENNWKWLKVFLELSNMKQAIKRNKERKRGGENISISILYDFVMALFSLGRFS